MMQHADVIKEATLYICSKWFLDFALEAKLKLKSLFPGSDFCNEIYMTIHKMTIL